MAEARANLKSAEAERDKAAVAVAETVATSSPRVTPTVL
jgi:hypothetical protein